MTTVYIVVLAAIVITVLVVFALLIWFINNREERNLKNIPHYRHDVVISGGVDITTGQMKKNSQEFFNGMGDYKFETVCINPNNMHNREISSSGAHCLYLIATSGGESYSGGFQKEIIIGRSPTSNGDGKIRINDGCVSGSHCRIMENAGTFYLEDLGSSNHTYLNQSMVTGLVSIRSEDIIKIGHFNYRVIVS